VQPPELRWPQLKVNAELPADVPATLGEAVFAIQCLPCHRLNGGGASEIRPDLGDASRQVKIVQLVHEAPRTGVNRRPMTQAVRSDPLWGDRPLRSKYGRLLQPSTYPRKQLANS
jgi:mono/diheme cytochrome c family protein